METPFGKAFSCTAATARRQIDENRREAQAYQRLTAQTEATIRESRELLLRASERLRDGGF